MNPHSDPTHAHRQRPRPQGLYHPDFEHDACGVAFIAHLEGIASHSIVQQGLHALEAMQHRGATNAERETGDGAGILLQIPDALYRDRMIDLPDPGTYATGIAFLPSDRVAAHTARQQIERIATEEGLVVLGWREVPVEPGPLGRQSRDVMPSFSQLFVHHPDQLAGIHLDREVYVLRKRIEHELSSAYFPSLSARTIVYKGMLTTDQLGPFYTDLSDPRCTSAIALVHSRFSTNTFPSWELAHPYRLVAHNGEINTVRGNRNRMRARESRLATPIWGDRIERILPICTPHASDTATLDEALELLHLGGYSLPHAVLMCIPEAWKKNPDIPPAVRDFYAFHSCLMEPWDGPASVSFTDGTVVGAVLDRNGLRPGRYWVTDDDRVVMASEVGVLDVPSASVIEKGRLEPGKMFLVDTERGRIVADREIKAELASAHPYGEWVDELTQLRHLPPRSVRYAVHDELVPQLVANGYTEEEIELLIEPMACNGKEALGSMGTDTPIGVLSSRPRLLPDYFAQLFAQVTNPPIDAIRESIVTSTSRAIGPEDNLLDPGPHSCQQLLLPRPVLTREELVRIVHANDEGAFPQLRSATVRGLFRPSAGGEGLLARLKGICRRVSACVAEGARIVVLSNRDAGPELAPIPSLLVLGAVHQHLVREKTRLQVGLVVDAADAREVHHFATLLGFGAAAICPSVVFELIEDRIAPSHPDIEVRDLIDAYVHAASQGIVKVMSKMGISTVGSYASAQIFEAVGLSQEVVDLCFTNTRSKLGGIGFDQIARECSERHRRAFPTRPGSIAHRQLELGGEYRWRREGEIHLFDPETVFKLQHATRSKQFSIFEEYTRRVDEQAERLATLRGLFRFRSSRPSIPVDQVEPVSAILKRFSTGAMSYGSISAEAHETLAVAMNRLGAKSNTGEGGEDPRRYEPIAGGDSKRSAIKQVASGRFGVTAHYLTNSDDIQIKMAQGAKPGEGGQLPGRKVWPWIAEVRHSTPGVGLISPPPHHDIYSIEDLAQLIHDLKNANPDARIHVKLVAEAGVGTVAAGVAKAKADVVLISGHDGGTGATPLTSLKHAGVPWEIGLAETQQTLLKNGMRDRILVQVDGQLKTGRDVVIAALLGAEEYGFATAPLVVMGCVMMRVCHLDTCPVGVATQNPVLRERFRGQPEMVETFFTFLAEQVRQILAELGFRSLDEAIGRAECLEVDPDIAHWKARHLDLSPLLHVPDVQGDRRCTQPQDHGLDRDFDVQLLEHCAPAIERKEPVTLQLPVSNVHRSVGTRLGHEITKKHGAEGLPDGTIELLLTGSIGNSFGAFVPRGVAMTLHGDANDYVGKGLSGGRLALRPPLDAPFAAEENVIAGNVLLYGATSGEVYIRGRVGERFCVRNSGATAVVEGIGDHGCEYMTGGRAVILGSTGRNFGAGMSGGIAWVFDADGQLETRINPRMIRIRPFDPGDVQARTTLRGLLERHHQLTDSVVAGALLSNWTEALARFVTVIPKDYERVLNARSRAEAQGTDPVAAVMEAANG